MLQDAFDSLSDILSPPFRKVMLKSLALTAAVLALAWLGLDRLALYFVNVQPSWLATLIAWLIGLGLLVGVVFLAAPVTSLVASFFFDEIAGHVEREIDPAGAPGRPAPFGRGDARLAALCRADAARRPRLARRCCSRRGSASSPGSPPTAICSGANISSSRRCASIPPPRRAPCASRTRAVVFVHGLLIAAVRRRAAGQPADAAVRHHADGAAA